MISDCENPTKEISSYTPIASITGIVVHGKGRGRTVGMPTANIQVTNPNEAQANSNLNDAGTYTNPNEGQANSNLNDAGAYTNPNEGMPTEQEISHRGWQSGGELAEGVFASIVHISSGSSTTPSETFLGVTNIGTRPTVDNERTIETHILDFNRDIYGETITIDLIEFLRGIKKFDSLEEVKKQVEKDIARTREIARKMKLPIRTGTPGGSVSPKCTGGLGAAK